MTVLTAAKGDGENENRPAADAIRGRRNQQK
jgi:hypothetical protein